uniref:CASP-like protein n=1 Tax=Oryza rufipogon TaxID=4529 RepID=A0A0E0RIX4_ORYRU
MPSSSSPAAAAAGEGSGRKKAAGRRLAGVMLLLRLASLCFAVAAAAFAATDGAALRAAPFRFLLAANAIVAVYSAFEVAAAAWEVAGGATLLPEAMQLWFDFGHDQIYSIRVLCVFCVSAAVASCTRRELAKEIEENEKLIN